PSSPRKTRSHSRLVSGEHADHGSTPGSPSGHLALTPVPVMKASSMEPVRGHPSGAEKRARHKMTDFQLQKLEALYQEDTHPSRAAKEKVAQEVGMTIKSVLIWFQNRRQDRRRKSTNTPTKGSPARVRRTTGQNNRKASGDAPKNSNGIIRQRKTATPVVGLGPATPVSVQSASIPSQATTPLPPHTIHTTESSQGNDSMEASEDSLSTAPTSVRHLPRVTRSPSSSLDSDSSDGSPYALWRFIVPSPPPPPPLPPTHIAQDGSRRSRHPFGNMQASDLVQRRPDLEWACANSAARRKHGYYVYRDEDDSEGESSEPEGRASTILPTIARDYDLGFSSDLMLGASLLLTFKNS
ncbi:hypothetical protein GY45DRAFT_1215456, partial [Cubamyces sp. BRFM 1775]